MLDISEWPAFWARSAPDSACIIDGDGTLTWRDFELRVGRVAAGLRARCGPGGRVGVLVHNRREYLITLFACARAGTVFVPLNPMLAAAELSNIVETAGASVLVSEPAFADRLERLGEVSAPVETYLVAGSAAGARPFASLEETGSLTPAGDRRAEDPLLLCFTSGTTGAAKGTVLTQGNVNAVADSMIAFDSVTARDRALVFVPLAFTGAGVAVSPGMVKAGGSILLRRSFDAATALDDLERNGATYAAFVPTILAQMAEHPSFADRDLAGWRIAKCGGAVVPPDLLHTYRSRGVDMVAAYGLTEASGLNLQVPPADAVRKLGCAGVPMLGQRVRVVGEDGQDRPTGEAGELLIAGPTVMQGYWGDPEATAAALTDGWLRTGDIATIDDEGYVTVVDRAKDVIISGGINIYPAELEVILARHPDIDEVAVVGAPDDRWGETPVVIAVSGNPELSLKDLAPLLSGTARYKWPTRLRLEGRPLPRSMSGKVLKRELRRAVDDPIASYRPPTPSHH